MARDVLIAAGCGLAAAVFYLSVLTGSSGALVLVYLTQFPLFLAGLSLGLKATAIAGAAGGAVSLATSGIGSTIFFLLIDAVPVALLVRQALLWRTDAAGRVWWYPAGRLLLCIEGLGAAAMLAGALYYVGAPGGLEGAVRGFLEGELGRFFGAGDAERDLVLTVLARIFPAMAVVSWLLMVTINGVLAQGVLARFGKAFRPAPDIVEIELPTWLVGLFAGLCALASFTGGTLGYLAFNLAILLGVAFVFAGLAVVHAAARRFAARSAVLIGAYLAMIILGWPILIVAALGFIEQWAGLRRRLAPSVPGQGEQ
jgi:Predicted membrane protein (DUF2232)